MSTPLHAMSSRVKVFRDDPWFDRVDKWWMVPAYVLESLHVATYDCATDDDGDVIDPEGCLAFIQGNHPGCVYVY